MSQPFIDKSRSDDSKPGKPGATRLDGWKEIATYLGRGERTVKRWETERGLPIHRVPGARGAVYAYTAELTDWLHSNPAKEVATEKDEEQPLAAQSASFQDGSATEAEEFSAAVASRNFTSLPAYTPIHESGPQLFMASRQRRWLVGLAGLLLLGITVASAQLAALHHRGLSIANTVSSLFGRKPQPVGSGVSASEKRTAGDLYLKGRYEWSQRTPDSLNRALDDFMQAVVHDPNDAKSYVGLADTYNLLQIYSTLPLTDSYPRAIAAAKRAVELDDSLAEAHRALAFAEFYGEGDWRNSEREFLRAIQLDPKDPVTRRWYANAFALPGRYEESLEQFNKAQELDPASHSTLSDKGIILFDAGKEDEGIALLKNVELTNPEFLSPHLYLMAIAFQRRDYRAFLEEGQKAAEIRKDAVSLDILAAARTGYQKNGEEGLLANLYRKQKDYFSEGKYPAGLLARTCVVLGKRQEAVHVLEIAYSRHSADALWCLTDPVLRTLKDEPRYKELIRKINFPPPGEVLSANAAEAEGARAATVH